MAKQNPWIIGILGFGVFLYLAWDNFERPFAPWIKTAETKAEIIDNALGYEPMGRGFTQIIPISYQVDDSVYVQKKKLSQRINKKEIGSEVFIEYAVKDPANFEIKGFLNIISKYFKSFELLNRYESENLQLDNLESAKLKN